MDDHWDLRSGPGCDSAGGKKFPSVSGLSLHVREWILLNFGKQKTVNWRNSEHFWLHIYNFWYLQVKQDAAHEPECSHVC